MGSVKLPACNLGRPHARHASTIPTKERDPQGPHGERTLCSGESWRILGQIKEKAMSYL